MTAASIEHTSIGRSVDRQRLRGLWRAGWAGALLVVLSAAAATVVILPYAAPDMSGEIRTSSLFGLLLAMDLLLGAWLVLRLQGRLFHGSRFSKKDPTGAHPPQDRLMRWSEGLMIGGFVALVLVIALAGYIAAIPY